MDLQSSFPIAPAGRPFRLAIVVSHPIQYYAPLYRLLAREPDLVLKVFFTWHGGQSQFDRGFGKTVAWDVPLTDGYEFVAVPNTSRKPGPEHFFGLRNPSLCREVFDWKPDAVHLTGYSYQSHLQLMRNCYRRNLPLYFRGDSHLLDVPRGVRLSKRILLRLIYRWPAKFLYVGAANRAYYEFFGVPTRKLIHCPHSVDVNRFAEPGDEMEAEAEVWRRELGIEKSQRVLLFAGKLEKKKQPLQLMDAVAAARTEFILLLAGDGELRVPVENRAAVDPARFRLLPFQNQSRMPVLYRVGDAFVLPSAYGETWGLAVNESLACGRPALVSDKVGCAEDVIEVGRNGDVFFSGNWTDFQSKVEGVFALGRRRPEIRNSARRFDISQTAVAMMNAFRKQTEQCAIE